VKIHHRCIVLESVNGPERTIIDCQDAVRALNVGVGVGSDSSNVIKGFTFRNGRESRGGAITLAGGTPVVKNCIFEGNVGGWGGAVIVSQTSVGCELTDCVFRENRAISELDFNAPPRGRGGAVYVGHGSLAIRRCEFITNTADEGAAVNVDGWMYPGWFFQLEISNCTIADNRSTNVTSAIHVEWGFEAHIEASILAANQTAEPVSIGNPRNTWVNLECTNIYGNAGGDWIGVIADQAVIDGNFSGNPYFCNPDIGDYRIHNNSPCAEENNNCGVLIGAREVWCTSHCGDIDGDGETTPTDIRLLQDLYFGIATSWLNPPGIADMDCDGTVTIADIILLAGLVHGYGPIPCCTQPPITPKILDHDHHTGVED